MKKGVKTMILGGVLMVSAIVIPLAVMVPSLSSEGPSDEQFQVPGVGVMEVDAPGRYYLWHDYKTTFEGARYSERKDIPSGVKIVVKGRGGEPRSFNYDSSISYSIGNRGKKSIGYIDATEPGPVIFEVSQLDDELVFSAGRYNLFKTLRKIGLSAVVGAVCGISGLVLFIWGIVKLVNAGKRERLLADQPPPL